MLKPILIFLFAFQFLGWFFTTQAHSEETKSKSTAVAECWSYIDERDTGSEETEIHKWTNSIYLWKNQGNFEGLFIYECGTYGEPIRVILKNMNVDKTSKKVSFQAEWQGGEQVMDEKSKKWIPMPHKVGFSGTVQPGVIEGVLTGSLCQKEGGQKIILKPDSGECSFEQRQYEDLKSRKTSFEKPHGWK